MVRNLLLLFPFTNPTRGFMARRLLRVQPCHECPIHLKTSILSPGFEHKPYGTAVSVTNHYNGLFMLMLMEENMLDQNVRSPTRPPEKHLPVKGQRIMDFNISIILSTAKRWEEFGWCTQ
ncbi:hypothetical protein TNCV_4852801 [Trichonephila clavipes]|nr:hypothetical protein TNCV_4852801 [Trichonephila clavipes]